MHLSHPVRHFRDWGRPRSAAVPRVMIRDCGGGRKKTLPKTLRKGKHLRLWTLVTWPANHQVRAQWHRREHSTNCA